MAKDGAVSGAQADEIEAILQEGKKKELNFVLMKAKGGVVLKCGPSVKGFPKLRAEAKDAGGMPALSVCGRLTVSGRTMNMTSVEEFPPDPALMRKLAAQSRKHFKALGIRPAKMVMTLPNGEIIDSDSVPDEEEGAAEPGDAAPVAAPGDGAPDPAEALKAELTERLRALVPQVKDAVARAAQGADRLAAALKAAGAEIAAGALDKAGQLLDAVEKHLKSSADIPAGDGGSAALKERLLSEFKDLSGDLRSVFESGDRAAAGKAQQFVQMFRTEIDGDLKKAGAILSALRRYVETELGRLAPKGDKVGGGTEGGGKDGGGKGGGREGPSIVETVTGIVGDVIDKVADTVTETVGTVVEAATSTPEELKQRAGLEALGLNVEQRNALMERLKTDPKAIETFKKDRMKAAGVPDDRQAALLKMSDDNPRAFAAALASLTTMEKGGAVDVSAEAVQKSLEDLEKARAETEARQKLADEAARKLAEVSKVYGEASKALGEAQTRAANAAGAIEELKARIGDPKLLTPEQKLTFAEESRRLMNENEAAKAALARALEAQKQASMDYADASDRNGKAQEALEKAREAQAGRQAVQDAKDGKKALLDAMAFGPLATGKLSDEDKAKFAEAYGRNARVADGLLTMAGSARDPSALAANAGFLAGKASDGFADKDGNRLDLPADELARMALNAARMGDLAGGDYFKDFAAYLDTGRQLAPDPTGGMDGPLADPKEEARRKNRVALARTQAMGAAAIKPDGTVDFGTEAARGQMAHMMFHPGALKTFTPQMTLKMAETKALFENPATRDTANGTIAATTLPANAAPGRNAALTLIAGTTGKDRGSLTDNDARAAVLGAMMTPLSQGPVGSCFSTAPVRAIRETDPLRAMAEYSRIATTGQFKSKSGDVYPANTHLPEGQNPLMRSWEYSVATAAADRQGSIERQRLRSGMFGTQAPGKNFNAVRDIVGAAAWSDSNDPATGDLVPGVRSKLMSAITTTLKFEYNAGPQVGGPSGGGDGHSTSGAYEILYKGKALTSEADFIAAMKEIALAATGETEASPKGAAIVALVTSADFKATILNGNSKGDYRPWKLAGGGFESQTAKVLDGGTLHNRDVLAANSGTPPKNQTDRTAEVLVSILAAHKSMTKDLAPLGTTGYRANHAFNTMPNHPSLAKIQDPGSADKIRSELIDPGIRIAGTKLPAAQAARLFEDQVKALMEGKSGDMRLLLVAALKNKPASDMTPAEIQAKVAQATVAYRDAEARIRADAYIAESEPAANRARRNEILEFYKDQVETGIKTRAALGLANAIPVPEVVVADSNWGGPENQTYFVAAPDPVTGSLMMWKRTMPGGKLLPLGKNWEDAKWDTVN